MVLACACAEHRQVLSAGGINTTEAQTGISSNAEYEAAADALLKVALSTLSLLLFSWWKVYNMTCVAAPLSNCTQDMKRRVAREDTAVHIHVAGCQVGDRKAAVKLLVRHACWQKLLAVSASLDPGRSSGHIQGLVTELRAAGQLDLAVQILLDIGETEVSSSGVLSTEALTPDELMHRAHCCAYNHSLNWTNHH